METLALVKPTAYEQMLSIIENMKRDNLTAVQLEKLAVMKSRIKNCFLNLTLTYFGLSREQVIQLSDQELDALFTLVSERARRELIYLKVLWITVPFLSWLLTFDLDVVVFTISLSKVKKTLGDKFDVVKLIRSRTYYLKTLT